MLVFAAVLVIFVYFTARLVRYFYLTWNFSYWRRIGVAGPEPVVVSGSFPKTCEGRCNLVEELHEIYLRYKATERFIGVFSGRTPRLFIVDPQLALDVLTTHFSSVHDNESSKWSNPRIEPLRCQSPFVSVGNEWKRKRAEITPTLTINRLRSLYPMMKRVAVQLSNFVKYDEEHELHLTTSDIAERFTIELISRFIWGIETHSLQVPPEDTPILQMARRMIDQALKCVQFYGRTEAWPLLRIFHTERFFPASSDKFFTDITTQSMAIRRQSPSQEPDVLNHLLQLSTKTPLSETDFAGHTTTMVIDGYKTASVLIAHCLLLLARNREKQEKLRQEIQHNREDDGSIAFDRLNNLPYLDQCIYETLRIFPLLPTLFKLCTAPITLENSNGRKVDLKPGDGIYISSYSFHKDPEIFENPEDFLPERFDEEAGGVRKYRDMGAFLPFGDGPRICLGMKLGLIEAKVAIAEIVSKFTITPRCMIEEGNRLQASSVLLSVRGEIDLEFKSLNK